MWRFYKRFILLYINTYNTYYFLSSQKNFFKFNDKGNERNLKIFLYYNDIYSGITFFIHAHNCWMWFLPFFQDLNELWDWGVSFRWVGKEWPDKMMAWNYWRHAFPPLYSSLWFPPPHDNVSVVVFALCIPFFPWPFILAQCRFELAQNT